VASVAPLVNKGGRLVPGDATTRPLTRTVDLDGFAPCRA
jgi:hypothetical protein